MLRRLTGKVDLQHDLYRACRVSNECVEKAAGINAVEYSKGVSGSLCFVRLQMADEMEPRRLPTRSRRCCVYRRSLREGLLDVVLAEVGDACLHRFDDPLR